MVLFSSLRLQTRKCTETLCLLAEICRLIVCYIYASCSYLCVTVEELALYSTKAFVNSNVTDRRMQRLCLRLYRAVATPVLMRSLSIARLEVKSKVQPKLFLLSLSVDFAEVKYELVGRLQDVKRSRSYATDSHKRTLSVHSRAVKFPSTLISTITVTAVPTSIAAGVRTAKTCVSVCMYMRRQKAK